MILSSYIKKLVAANKTHQALSVLDARSENHDPPLQKEITLHLGNYNRLKEDILKGKISRAEEKQAFIQINQAILDLLPLLPSDPEVEVNWGTQKRLNLLIFIKNHHPKIILGIWGILILVGIILLYLPKRGIKIAMDVSVSKVSFVAVGDNKFSINKEVAELQVENFEQIQISGNQVFLFEDDDHPMVPYSGDNSGLIRVSPSSGDLANFLFLSVLLEEITFQDTTRINVTIPESEYEEERFLLLETIPGNIKGVLYFQDSLAFEANNVQFSSIDRPFDWTKGSVRTTSDGVLPVYFSGKDYLSIVLLLPEKSSDYSIKKQNLYVKELDFKRKDLGVPEPESSILKGRIQFLNKKDKAYNEVELKPNDFLYLEGYDKLQLISFDLSNTVINARLTGTLHEVYTSTTVIEDERVLQNPSWWQWVLSNQLAGLALVVSLGIFLSIGIYAIAQNQE